MTGFPCFHGLRIPPSPTCALPEMFPGVAQTIEARRSLIPATVIAALLITPRATTVSSSVTPSSIVGFPTILPPPLISFGATLAGRAIIGAFTGRPHSRTLTVPLKTAVHRIGQHRALDREDHSAARDVLCRRATRPCRDHPRGLGPFERWRHNPFAATVVPLITRARTTSFIRDVKAVATFDIGRCIFLASLNTRLC